MKVFHVDFTIHDNGLILYRFDFLRCRRHSRTATQKSTYTRLAMTYFVSFETFLPSPVLSLPSCVPSIAPVADDETKTPCVCLCAGAGARIFDDGCDGSNSCSIRSGSVAMGLRWERCPSSGHGTRDVAGGSRCPTETGKSSI